MKQELRIEDLTWLHALARSLVQDPNRADDAVQDTLVVALDHEPRDERALRGWLASILRNVLRQARRGEARREAREAAVPPTVSAPSTLEVVEELARHRELVELVQGLEEPYRTTIHQRYLRGMTAREIASAGEIPVKTVHTRIARALERLRRRLDVTRDGDRDAWIAALLPLANASLAPPPQAAASFGNTTLPSPLTPAGVGLGSLLFTVNMKAILTCVCALALGAALYLGRDGGDVERSREEEPHAAGAALPASRPLEKAASVPFADDRLELDELAVNEASPEAARAVPRIRGEVRATDGRGIRGVSVVLVPSTASDAPRVLATSEAGGAFECDAPETPGRLSVESELYSCLSGPRLAGGVPPERPVVLVAPRRRYGGRVVDERGKPLADVRVEIDLQDESGLLFTVTLQPDGRSVHVLRPLAETVTDERGRFFFDSVGALAGSVIEASRDGFEGAALELAPYDDFDVELTLSPSPAGNRAVFGVVLDPDGVPVRGAFVSCGWGCDTVSDSDGRFVVQPAEWGAAVTLRAVVRGRLPASLEYDPRRAREGRTSEDPVRLFVGAEPLAIAGVVVDERGERVAGAEVWTPDVSYFGATTSSDGEKSLTGESLTEALIVGRANPHHPRYLTTTSDELGRFRLDGLLDRGYTLLAVVPSTLAASEPRVVRGGVHNATLRLSAGTQRRIAGQLLSTRGAPLANVRVALGRAASESAVGERALASWSDSPLPPPSLSRSFLDASSVRTDAAGRFAFERLSTDGAFLLFVGDALQWPHTHPLNESSDLESLRIEVEAGCRFRVVLEGDPSEADAFRLVGADGDVRSMLVPVSDVVISAPSAELIDGRSGVVVGTEGPVTIVLSRDGKEVRRVAVDLPAGSGHTIGL